MELKSALIRVLYYADRHQIERKSRLHSLLYLIDEEIDIGCSFRTASSGADVRLYCDDIDEAVSEMSSLMLLSTDEDQTYEGESVHSYYLTEKGTSRCEKLITESEEDKKIRDICEEYRDVPLSNLLKDIRESASA